MKEKLILSTAIMLIVFELAFATIFNRAQVLKFETIEKGERLGIYYGPEHPHMMIIAQLADIDKPIDGLQFSPELVGKLRAINYQKYFVAILFHGMIGYLDPDVNINPQWITHSRERVNIHAFLSKQPRLMGMILSSPYRIIKVSKTGQWNSEVTFILNVGLKEMDRQTRFVP
jgi:hypothetical protein